MTEADCHVVSFSERLRDARVPPRTISNALRSDTELLDLADEAHPRKKPFDWFVCSMVGLICFPCTGVWAMYYSLKSYTAQMQNEEADCKRFNRKVKCFSVMSILLGLITLGALATFIVIMAKNVRFFEDDPVDYDTPAPKYKNWGFDKDNSYYDNWPSHEGNVKYMQQGPMKTEKVDFETNTPLYDNYENDYGSDTTPTYDDYSNEYDSDDYSNEYEGDDYSHDSSEEPETQYYDDDPVNYNDDGRSEEKAAPDIDHNSEYDYRETNETDGQDKMTGTDEASYEYYDYPKYDYTENNETDGQDMGTSDEYPNNQNYYYPNYDNTETNEPDGLDKVTGYDEPNYQYNDYPKYDYTETNETDGQDNVTGNEDPKYQYNDYPEYDYTETKANSGQDEVTIDEEPNYQYSDYPKYDKTEANATDGQDTTTNNVDPNYQYYDYPTYDYTETNETDGQDKMTGNEDPNYQYYDDPKYDYADTNESDGQDNADSKEELNYQSMYYEYPEYDDKERNETDAQDNSTTDEELANTDGYYGEARNHDTDESVEKPAYYYEDMGSERHNPSTSVDNVGLSGGEVPSYYDQDGDSKEQNPELNPDLADLPDYKTHVYIEYGEVPAPNNKTYSHIYRAIRYYENGAFKTAIPLEIMAVTVAVPIKESPVVETAADRQGVKVPVEVEKLEQSPEEADNDDKKGEQTKWSDIVTPRILAGDNTTPQRMTKEKVTTHQPLWKKLGYKK